MSLRPAANTPTPLIVAASLVAVEGMLLLGYAVLELASLDADRAEVAVSTSVFFLLYGGGLLCCAWALTRLGSWARSPAVLAQLIQLGVAWSFWGGDTTGVALAIAAVAVVVLAGIFHPASLAALAAAEEQDQRRG